MGTSSKKKKKGPVTRGAGRGAARDIGKFFPPAEPRRGSWGAGDRRGSAQQDLRSRESQPPKAPSEERRPTTASSPAKENRKTELAAKKGEQRHKAIGGMSPKKAAIEGEGKIYLEDMGEEEGGIPPGQTGNPNNAPRATPKKKDLSNSHTKRGAIMVQAQIHHKEGSQVHEPNSTELEMESSTVSSGGLGSIGSLLSISGIEGTPPGRGKSPPQNEGELSWKEILKSFPTKGDLAAQIDSAVARIENSLRSEMAVLQQANKDLDKRVTALEVLKEPTEDRLTRLEGEVDKLKKQNTQLFLLNDDQENRSRRNNVKVRGIPETYRPHELHRLVLAIFNSILEKPVDAHIELDRVHRTPLRRGKQELGPRDVVCRVHFFTIREEILRRAWDMGTVDWKDFKVQIFPDISKNTLAMRRMVKPLLMKINEAGAYYKWGYPFHIVVQKHQETHYVRSPKDLPDIFRFLGVEPVEVPNWLDHLGNEPPRQQRARWK